MLGVVRASGSDRGGDQGSGKNPGSEGNADRGGGMATDLGFHTVTIATESVLPLQGFLFHREGDFLRLHLGRFHQLALSDFGGVVGECVQVIDEDVGVCVRFHKR